MTTTSVKIGDVVQLKSGGPSMTVTSTGHSMETRVNCAWFDGATTMSGWFPAAALQLATSGVGGAIG